jgi:membrane-bound serine protease (ClpP class)
MGPLRALLVLALSVAPPGAPATAASVDAASPAEAGPPRALSLTVNGPITPATTEYLDAGLGRARDEAFDVVCITLDTPGGQLEATREIVQHMLASTVPIVVWVGPAGARAGSAGVFITLSANVAAMHPTSNIGAAHPVTAAGGDVEKEAGKDMAKKIENDTAAFARSIAVSRGRNADWAEKAVRESVSVTADEAVRQKVIDLVAPDLPHLLATADGRRVEAAGGVRLLRSKGATLIAHDMTIRQRTLAFLADPNIVAILMLVGTLGILLELYHPGSLVPGIAGGLCLLLAFLAGRVIPVNVGAVVLLLAGAALLVSEAYITTHGIAGIAGAACVLVATLLFIDKSSPDYRFDPGAFTLSPLVVWPVPIAMSGLALFVAWTIVRSRRGRLVAGATGLVGESGEAITDVGPDAGSVFVHGEYWSARADPPVPRGAHVRVTAVSGLTVRVVVAAESTERERSR